MSTPSSPTPPAHALPYPAPPPLRPSTSFRFRASTSNTSSLNPFALARLIPALSSQLDSLLTYTHTPSAATQQSYQTWWHTTGLISDLERASARLRVTSYSLDRETSSTLQRRVQQDLNRARRLLDTIDATGTESVRFTDSAFASTSTSGAAKTTTKTFRDIVTQSLSRQPGGDFDAGSQDDDDGEDQADVFALTRYDSEAESELADLEADDLQANSKPLSGLRPATSVTATDTSAAPITTTKRSSTASSEAEELELDEYDRAAASRHPRSSNAPSPPSPTTPAPAAAAAGVAPSQSDTILQSDRTTHDALSSELLRMASVLKSNSLAFADALERDRMLVEKAGHDLSGNLDLLTRTRGKLGIYSKKARSMGWLTLGNIVIVLVSWVFMFFVIRLT